MKTRAEFSRALAGRHLTHAERAVALLWYYRQAQQYEERTAAELAADLQEEGFPKPNTTRLHDDLQRGRFTVRGSRPAPVQPGRKLRQIAASPLPFL